MNGSLRTIVSFFMNIYSLGLITGLLITSFAQADAPANLRPPGDTATWRQDLSDQAWEKNSRKQVFHPAPTYGAGARENYKK